MKKVLVYPCGTEIGLEIYRALENSIHYEIYGGSSSYDHGRFIYKNHIDNLPYITDFSSAEEIKEFNSMISTYEFDFIYPAMDGVLTVFTKYKHILKPVIIGPDYQTTEITRSKRKTYEVFKHELPIPQLYGSINEIKSFPIFMKPDIGQGAVGATRIDSEEELLRLKKNDDTQLLLELLPGEEYTIDCFTNSEGELVYFRGRTRRRVKGGISVNAVFCDRPEFEIYAKIINSKLQQKGAWFFQLKEDANGQLKLLEIASRIAGTSAIERNIGVNLPLLTLNVFSNIPVKDVVVNDYSIELDRALGNVYKLQLDYETVYVDYDDTVIVNGTINTKLIKFIYQCINKRKKIVLLSKHEGDLLAELKIYRIESIFDEVIHISRNDDKYRYITDVKSIFIDDSYGERKAVFEKKGINVFDIHMIEGLLEE